MRKGRRSSESNDSMEAKNSTAMSKETDREQ